MQPVTVTTDVPIKREVVYDFLDVTANHERFMDHMLTAWHFSGPERGVGSKTRVTAKAGPLVRSVMRQGIRRGMERLAALLAVSPSTAARH